MSEEEKYEQLRQVCLSYRNEVADLEAKLAESEKLKESYRLQNDEHHLQLCQFYSRLGVEAFGADIHEKALETLMIMKEELEEKNGVRRALSACNRQNDEFADMIKKLVSEKEELKQQLAEKEKFIEELKPEICKKCRKHIQKNYVDCAFQKFDNEYCGDLEEIIEHYAKYKKISFAVEQLEKVKEYVDEKSTTQSPFGTLKIYASDVSEIIDNQIKQLKEGK